MISTIPSVSKGCQFFIHFCCKAKSFPTKIKSVKAIVLKYTSKPYPIRLRLIPSVGLVCASMVTLPSPAEESILLNNNNFNQYINADQPINGTYFLEESIDLSKYDQWQPAGNDSVPFSVKLNGNYQIISGLNSTQSMDRSYSGLFGYLVNSRVERLIIDKPVIGGKGGVISMGSVAGRVKNTTITEVINHSGSIRANGRHVNAGGIVGIASDYSIIKNNLATGKINIEREYLSNTGGIVASAQMHSTIMGNLFSGELESGGRVDNSAVGGIAGSLSGHSSAKNNLHTGSIVSKSPVSLSDYGGIAGRAVDGSTIAANLNIGPLKLRAAWTSASGGIAGFIEKRTTVERNVNAGALYQADGGSFRGGIVGRGDEALIQQNMNNGEITNNLYLKKDRAFARVGGLGGWGSGLIAKNNLNTGDIIAGNFVDWHHGIINGTNVREQHNLQVGRILTNTNSNSTAPPILVDRTPHKNRRGFEDFDKKLWNSSPHKTYPMLRNINANYQDLLRLNNTQSGNNVFPAILDQFATPGGSTNASLLDLKVWNVRDGYLPFLSGVSGRQAALAGINCEQGGFACSPALTILPTASSVSSMTTSSSTYTSSPESTIAPMATSLSSTVTLSSTINASSFWAAILPTATSLSSATTPSTSIHAIDENCPPPKGVPFAQAYDITNHQLYVAIRAPSKPDNLVLARYIGTALDRQFGRCGKKRYQLPNITDWDFIEDSVISGENNHRYIHLVANTPDKQSRLLRLRLPQGEEFKDESEKEDDKADYIINDLPAPGFKVNMMAAQHEALYLAGRFASEFFISRIEKGKPLFESLGKQKKISNLFVSPDDSQLYIAGIETIAQTAFLQAYSTSPFSRNQSFGINGEVRAITPDHFQSHKAFAAAHGGWIYIATITRNGDQLSIRRLDPDNGQVDGTFVVDEALPNDLTDLDAHAGIQLCPNGKLLHAVKYDKNGNIFIATYDDLKEVHRVSKSLEHADILFNGLTVTDNRMYLPYRPLNELGTSDTVKVMEVSLNDLQPDSNNSNGFPVWGYIVATTAPVTIAVASVTIFLKFRTKSYHLRRSEKVLGVHELVPLPNN